MIKPPVTLQKLYLLYLCLSITVSAVSCKVLFPEDPRNLLSGDLVPPTVVSVLAEGEREIQILFDKPVTAEKKQVSVSGGNEVTGISRDGLALTVHIRDAIPPGERQVLDGIFRDGSHNQLMLITPVYGYNPNPAGLLINEFTTRGNDTHPDRVELLVTSSGNTAGITFFDGVKHDYRQKKVLPAIEVTEGEYLIIHCRSTDPAALDETEDPSSSQLPGTHDEAWDVFIPDGVGLSSNNGVLSLYDSPEGACMNGVFYSNRTSQSDDQYRGFGSSSMKQRTMALCSEGGWDACPQKVKPEDGIESTYSTATRSMSRIEGSSTDSRNDWIVVPTRGATFGYENNQNQYHPDP